MTIPYTFTPLAYPTKIGPDRFTDGYDINDSGQVVGAYGNHAHAFLYSGGIYTNIDPVPRPDFSSFGRIDISNDGKVLEYYFSSVEPLSSFSYIYEDGACTAINVPGAQNTVGTAISDVGVVGYWSAEGQAQYQGFTYEKNENGVYVYTTINVPGAQNTMASGINDSGQVIGYDDLNGTNQGFLYDNGIFTPIVDPNADFSGTSLMSINNYGQIAGYYLINQQYQCFMYDDGVFTDITVPGASKTWVWGISDAGAFGYYFEGGVEHGFIYEGGVYTTVDDPNAPGTAVTAMSDSGQQLIVLINYESTEIGNVNDTAPVITTAADQSIAENTTVVAALTSTDVDGVGTNPAIFSITGGADAVLFQVLTAADGSQSLQFVTAPDYEINPHSYQVQVSAFDGVNSSSELITVNVTNVSGVTIMGTAHSDMINATTTVTGQPLPTNEEDTINAGGGNDTINALGGNDFINGGSGSDTMRGGAGNDTYVVDFTRDVVTENSGEGIDTVLSSVTYALGTNVENLTLTGTSNINGTGNAADNIIIGNSGNNTLSGLAGADTIDGSAGNDVIIGGSWADVLKGGTGNDKFVFASLIDSLPNTPDTITEDTITDFTHGADIINLSAIDANTGKGGDQAFLFPGGQAVVAHSVTWTESDGNTIVHADVNGDTTADLTIVLTGIHPLTVSDFIL